MRINIDYTLKILVKKRKKLSRYISLRNSIKTLDISKDSDFQEEFNSFYRVRKNADWKKSFFNLFEKLKLKDDISFKYILTELYKQTGKCEPIYASRILNTLNPSMPTWDLKVLRSYGVTNLRGNSKYKITKLTNLYQKFLLYFNSFFSSQEEKNNYLNKFDKEFPVFKNIDSAIKFYFILWTLENNKKDEISYFYHKSYLQETLKIIDFNEINNNLIPVISNFAKVISEQNLKVDSFAKSFLDIYQKSISKLDFHNLITDSLEKILGELPSILSNYQLLIPKITIPTSILKTLGDICYIQLLEQIEWPLYLESDKFVKKIITSKCNIQDEEIPLVDIAKELCIYYSNEKIDFFAQKWEKLCTNQKRLKLLQEAIKLHKSGLYFGSTSLLMCQVNGLICEIYQIIEKNHFSFEKKNVREICEYFEIDYNNHLKAVQKKNPSERHLMIRLMLYDKTGNIYTKAVIEYIYKIILTSTDGLYEEHNPLRNKICHGTDLEFGTEEKSLKSILVIDLLLSIEDEIKCLTHEQYI